MVTVATIKVLIFGDFLHFLWNNEQSLRYTKDATRFTSVDFKGVSCNYGAHKDTLKDNILAKAYKKFDRSRQTTI